MNRCLYLLLCIVLFNGISFQVSAQVITHFAGNGTVGYSGDGMAATTAQLDSPTSLASDAAGNIYINDQRNSCIRKVSAAGIITTIAGTGTAGYNGDNIPATAAMLNQNWGLAVDASGNVYIADQSNYRIRKVNTAGIITTIAGTGTGGFSGDNGPATAAQIQAPWGIAVDDAGNVYIGDANNFCVRKINVSGTISTVAGNRLYGFSGDGGPATAASLSYIWGLSTDRNGNLYICDAANNRIRMVDGSGTINTVAGSGAAGSGGDGGPALTASLNSPLGVHVTATGELLIADYKNNKVRKVSATGIMTTVAGTGSAGYSGDDGPATAAELFHPIGVTTDVMGNSYVSDMRNVRIRKIIKTLAFTNGPVQRFSICQNSPSASLDALLSVFDYYPGHTDTWSLEEAPVHGTATTAYSTPSTGGIITPTGLIYVPAAGYTGNDSFKVKVSSGIASDITTIYVSINSVIVSAGIITGPSSLCVGADISLGDTVAGGAWSSTNGSATIGSTGVAHGVAAGVDTIVYTISNSCGTVSTSKEMTVNPLPDAGTISGPSAVCVNSTTLFTETVAGGTWSTSNTLAIVGSTGSVHALFAGTVTLIYTVSDTRCTATAIHLVDIEVFPDAGTITGPEQVCLGAEIDLQASATGGTWSTSDSSANVTGGKVKGVYVGNELINYSITNSCGTDVTSQAITIDPLPEVPVISEQQSVLTVPAGYASYQWLISGVAITGAVTDTLYATETGSYFVAVTNSHGCAANSLPYTYAGCSPGDIVLYPNPAGSSVSVKWCKQVVVRLMSVDGRELYVAGNSNDISLSGLPDGVYLLSIFDVKGEKLVTKRVTKLTK